MTSAALLMLLAGSGCSPPPDMRDQRLVELARESMDRQAEQNRHLARQSEQIIDAGRDSLEQERRQIAELRHREPGHWNEVSEGCTPQGAKALGAPPRRTMDCSAMPASGCFFLRSIRTWRRLVGPRAARTEGARAALNQGFETLGFQQVVATVQAANAASIRVVEKLGMILVESFQRHGREVLLFRTTGDQVPPGRRSRT